jgi:hypothetical protein
MHKKITKMCLILCFMIIELCILKTRFNEIINCKILFTMYFKFLNIILYILYIIILYDFKYYVILHIFRGYYIVFLRTIAYILLTITRYEYNRIVVDSKVCHSYKYALVSANLTTSHKLKLPNQNHFLYIKYFFYYHYFHNGK